MALNTSVLTGGTNSHQTTSEEANAVATDILSAGIIGSLASTSGVAPMTGGYAVNAQGTPDMTVAVSTGVAYVTATPSGGNSQLFRVKNSASTNVTIAANASGGTRYDWVYIQLDATKLANPNSAGTDAATLVTSRSTSNTTDNGTPPTYGTLLAVITVANGASSITNGNITDSRTQTVATSSTTTLTSAIVFDHVNSGCVWTADSAGSTLAGSMTAGVVYVSGTRASVSAVSAHSFTASKDTYVDVDSTGTLTYTEVANNAASPALSTGRMRLAIIVTNGSSIAASTSINQGQESRVLPIASSVPYAVTDSLGNLICPRDPNRKILGYRQITSNATSSSTSDGQVTGLSCPVIVPTNRKVEISFFAKSVYNNTTNDYCEITIWDGTVGSGTQLQRASYRMASGITEVSASCTVITTPSATSKTYNIGQDAAVGGTSTISAGSTLPAYVVVKLV